MSFFMWACTAPQAPALQNISLDKTEVSLVAGETAVITAEAVPAEAEAVFEWSTSDGDIATVSNGTVTAIAPGEAVITVNSGDISASCEVTVRAAEVGSVILDKEEATLQKGETLTLTATVLPENAEDKTVTWHSSSDAVAEVDENGTVTAIETGEAVITAEAGGFKAECRITVVGIPVETITLNETVIELNKGETFKLEAEVSPENADCEGLSWTSSDEDVATVSQEGLVTAVASGDAVISVSTGDISAECTVTVIGKPVESISFDTYSLEMEPGYTYYIITMISPGDADDKTLIWSSSDENVATVSDGTVTAIAPGSAEITASCGTAYATCYVTVNESAQPGSAQIGDFYYSDGTWSPQLDNSKTLIGIVFYVGDPAKDDAMLKADYPGCTHGLAVSIVEFTGPWQSNYDSYGKLIDEWGAGNLSGYESLVAHYGYAPDDNLNKMLGYNNTKAIKAFNDDPQNASWPVDIVKNIDTFNADYPAPASSSGWYLPSMKDLSLLITGESGTNVYDIMYDITNVYNLNQILSEAGLATMNSSMMWSSSEVDESIEDSAFTNSATDSWCSESPKNTSFFCTYRYILAF